jgi:purine-binding chemotaxis protein CheW
MRGPRLEQMPKGEEEVRILRQRAALLREEDTVAPLATAIPYVKFRLGKECFGIPHGYVAEMVSPAEIAPLPWVPPVIAGVLNRRGALLAVADLRALFRVAEAAKDAGEPTVIIVAAAGLTVGILADRIEGELQFRPEQLGEAVQWGGIAKLGHVLGIADGVTTILNIEGVLGDIARAVNGARPKTVAPHPSPTGDE